MRKSRFFALLCSAVLLSLSPVHACAEQAVVTGNEVNVRSGPGTAYGIFASLDRDATVEVLNRSDPDWYLVSWDGSSGYVSAQFLSLLEEDKSAIVTVAQEEAPGYISGMYVCLRSGPDTSYTILGSYSTGKTLTITGRSGEWVAVRIDGKDGFVYQDFVIEGSPNAAVIEDPSPDSYGGTPIAAGNGASSQNGPIVFVVQSSPLPTVEVTLSPEQIVSVPTDGVSHTPAPVLPASGSTSGVVDAPSSSSGTVIPVRETAPVPAAEVSTSNPEESSAAQDVFSTRKIGRITGDAVRLRSGPGSTYSITGIYERDTEVSVSGVSGEWVAVTVQGVSGYMHSDFVKISDSQNAAESAFNHDVSASVPASFHSADGFITGSSVRLRESPSMSANILAELNFGTAVRMTGVSGDWIKVITGGQEGFVYSSFVTEGVFEPSAQLSSASGSELGKEIAAYALQFLGAPYKWGGSSPETGFDCSGFVQYVYGQFGYTTSRVANDAISDGVHVEPDDLQPGDLLCFYSGSNYIGHLGIYIGDQLFVHAANSATGVVTTTLESGYYAQRGYEIRRLTA